MRASHGFTLIELLISLAIVGILAALAAPSARGLVANGRIRSLSESMTSGLELARAEAVRLNTPVTFQVNATGWVVQRADTLAQLHQGTGRENLQNGVTVNFTPAAATEVTFDSFGRSVDPNPDGTARITQVDLVATDTSGISSSSYHPLRIQMLASGLPRLCDIYAGANTPKACL
jgi:type IV fimbrial biogenesis protein FimT